MQLGQIEADAKASIEAQVESHSGRDFGDPADGATGSGATTTPAMTISEAKAAPIAGATASFQPPIGHQCTLLQVKLSQVENGASLRPLLQECTKRPAEWSHLNVVKALQLLKLYLPFPEPSDWRGLKRRAGDLLNEALAALRLLHGPSPPDMVRPPDIRHPTALMHEVLFHPRTVGLLVHALAKLGGQRVLFHRASAFVLLWLSKPGFSTALEPQDMANIVWAYSNQGSELARDPQLFHVLARHFEISISGADEPGQPACTPQCFSNIMWGLAKYAGLLCDRPSCDLSWASRVVPRASQYALQHLRNFRPEELTAVIWAFGRLGSSEGCRPFLVETLNLVANREQIQRYEMQDAVCLAEQFSGFTDGALPMSPVGAEGSLRLTPEVLEGHTELCTALQRPLRAVAEMAVEKISELKPLQLSSLMRTLAKARVSHEPLFTAVLERGVVKLQPGAEPPMWSPQEITAVLSGIAALFAVHMQLRHVRGCRQGLGDEKLSIGLTMFVRAMGSTLPGRIRDLTPEIITEMVRCLGILSDGIPTFRRKLHGSPLGLREAAGLALTSTGLRGLGLEKFTELAVGLARLNTDLACVDGLLACTVSQLKSIPPGSPLQGTLLRAAPLLWALAVHGACAGRQPPLLQQGLLEAVLNFASAISLAVLKALTHGGTAARDGVVPALGEDAFSKQRSDAPQAEETQHADQPRDNELGISPRLRASELAPALWALAALARTDGGAELQRAPGLEPLIAALAQPTHAGCALLAGSLPSELGDLLWALGRLGATAGPSLRAHVAMVCEVDADFWTVEMLRGHVYLGRLLWGAVTLMADNPPGALLDAARRIAARLPELVRGQPDADTFVALLWALAAVDAINMVSLSDALVSGLRMKPAKASTDGPTSVTCPTGTWEWALLRELLVIAAPRAWPSQWLGNSKQCWDREHQVATKLLGDDVHLALDTVLAKTGMPVMVDADVPASLLPNSAEAWRNFCSIRVDASIPERQWCIELVPKTGPPLPGAAHEKPSGSLASTVLKHGRECALKWRVLASRGWVVLRVPVALLQCGATEVKEAIDRALFTKGDRAVVPVCLPMDKMGPHRPQSPLPSSSLPPTDVSQAAAEDTPQLSSFPAPMSSPSSLAMPRASAIKQEGSAEGEARAKAKSEPQSPRSLPQHGDADIEPVQAAPVAQLSGVMAKQDALSDLLAGPPTECDTDMGKDIMPPDDKLPLAATRGVAATNTPGGSAAHAVLTLGPRAEEALPGATDLAGGAPGAPPMGMPVAADCDVAESDTTATMVPAVAVAPFAAAAGAATLAAAAAAAVMESTAAPLAEALASTATGLSPACPPGSIGSLPAQVPAGAPAAGLVEAAAAIATPDAAAPSVDSNSSATDEAEVPQSLSTAGVTSLHLPRQTCSVAGAVPPPTAPASPRDASQDSQPLVQVPPIATGFAAPMADAGTVDEAKEGRAGVAVHNVVASPDTAKKGDLGAPPTATSVPATPVNLGAAFGTALAVRGSRDPRMPLPRQSVARDSPVPMQVVPQACMKDLQRRLKAAHEKCMNDVSERKRFEDKAQMALRRFIIEEARKRASCLDGTTERRELAPQCPLAAAAPPVGPALAPKLKARAAPVPSVKFDARPTAKSRVAARMKQEPSATLEVKLEEDTVERPCIAKPVGPPLEWPRAARLASKRTVPKAKPQLAPTARDQRRFETKFDDNREARAAGGNGSCMNKSTQEHLVTNAVQAARYRRLADRGHCLDHPARLSAGSAAGDGHWGAAAVVAAERSLVQVELCYGAKRKRLQLQASVTIGQLIEQYGSIVKGCGNVIVMDQKGLEHGADITMSMLAEEAATVGSGALIKLQLCLDDW